MGSGGVGKQGLRVEGFTVQDLGLRAMMQVFQHVQTAVSNVRHCSCWFSNVGIYHASTGPGELATATRFRIQSVA